MSEQPASTELAPQWDVADRMRKALRHAEVGVQEVADYLGVTRGTVGTWINGRIEPSVQTLRLVAMRCGVSYEWLRDGIGEDPQPPNPGPGLSAVQEDYEEMCRRISTPLTCDDAEWSRMGLHERTAA